MTKYHDGDSDGYGDPDDSITDCSHASDFTSDNTDCDDTQDSVYPGADEYCNEEDDDCDGTIDEDDSLDASTWYIDADADGYGSSATTSQACLQPSGYVADSTDCDDSSDSTYPYADEICEDSADNDCDGTTDECAIQGDLDASTDAEVALLGEVANDNAGTVVSGLGDIDNDGNDDVGVGAPYYDGDSSNIGAAYVLYGSLSSGSWSLSGADAMQYGTSSSGRGGSSLASLGDTDSDGYGEFLVGAPFADASTTNGGEVWVLEGPLSGAAAVSGYFIHGTDSNAYFGTAVDGCDLDQDGVNDVVVGSTGVSNGTYDSGGVYLFSGPITADTADSSASALLAGQGDEDQAGHALACLTDNDGDGYDDLVVGAHYKGNDSGVAYVVHGIVTSDGPLSDETNLSAGASEDLMGHSVSDAGDWDGDGYGDLVIGAPYGDGGASEAGETYIFLGPTTADAGVSSADITIEGATANDFSGWSVASGFDSDGDGNPDLAIGAYGNDDAATSAGAAYLFYGPLSSGTWGASSAHATITGSSSNDQLGYSVSGAGDTDADGYDDLIIGARRESTTDTYAGAAYLFMGDER